MRGRVIQEDTWCQPHLHTHVHMYMCKHTQMYTHTYVSKPAEKLRSFSCWCFSGRTKLQGHGIRRNTRPMIVFSKCLYKQQECEYKKFIQKYQIALMFFYSPSMQHSYLSPTFVHMWDRALKSQLPWLSKQKSWPVIIQSSRRIQRNSGKNSEQPQMFSGMRKRKCQALCSPHPHRPGKQSQNSLEQQQRTMRCYFRVGR